MATARVVIKGENQMKASINDAKKDLTGFQSVVSNAGSVMSKALSVTAVIGGLKLLGSTLKDLTKEGSQFQSAIGNLQTALGVSDKEMATFTKSLNKLDDQTKASRLDLIEYAQSFKAFDLSTKQVEKLLQASINLSNVTGKDLSSSISAVQKSLTGSTSALEKMGVEVDELTEAQLKNGEVADLLIKKYGELSDAMQIGDSQQLLDNISSTLTRIKQDLGTGIINAISPALETLYGWLLKIEEWAENQNENRRIKPYTDAVDIVNRTTIGGLANTYGMSGEEIISAYNGAGNVSNVVRNNIISAIESVNRPMSELIREWQRAVSNMQIAYATVYGIPTAASSGSAVSLNDNVDSTNWDYVRRFGISDSKAGFGNRPFSTWNGFRNVLDLPINAVSQSTLNSLYGFAPTWIDPFAIENAKSGFGEKPFSTWNGFRNVLDLPVNEVSQSTLDNLFGFKETPVGTARFSRFGSDLNFTPVDPFGRDKGLAFGFDTGNKAGSEFTMLDHVMNEIISGIGGTISAFSSLTNVFSIGSTVFGAFTGELGRLLGQILDPLTETLEWIGTALADTLVPIFSALMPAIQGVVTIIKSVLTPVLDGLTWIFSQVAAGLQLITGTIQWAADWIRYGIGKATFWDGSDNVSKPGSYGSYITGGGMTAGAMTTSTETAIASASYMGGNNITINIYQSGAVVGDSGMKEFAQMIKNEFDNLNYYGVA